MSDIAGTQLNLEKILLARLEITQQERNGIKDSCDVLDGKIKGIIAKIGSRPKLNIEQISNEIKRLEHDHSTTTQSKADERQFMRDLDKLKQTKKLTIEYNKSNDELEALKDRRSELYQELRDIDKTLEDLQNGLRKVQTASRLQCSTSEIIEISIPVSDEAMPRVIGKGGQNLRQIENDFKVSLETEKSGCVKIMGTEAAINLAKESIMNVINTSSIEISPSDETIVCMLLKKTSLCSELQLRHNVRIDISRAKKTCKIIGLSNSIAATVVDINLIESARAEILFDVGLLPAILGKSGSNIRNIEENLRVQVDINKDESKVIVVGFQSDVKAAENLVHNIISENREVEETIRANHHVIVTCIIGNGGSIVRGLQKDLNIGIRVEKNPNNTNNSNNHHSSEESDLDTIIIRGNTAKVAHAKEHLLTLLKEFYSQTCRVEVPKDSLSVILGKKGAHINKLREDFPEASIDVEGSVVYIQSTSDVTRYTLKITIEALVAGNFMKSVDLHPDVAISLKGTRGAELRTTFTSDLSLTFKIDTDSKSIKFRGLEENVEKAIILLNDFIQQNHCEDFLCDSEDCLSLVTPVCEGQDSPQKQIEKQYGVDIYINRQEKLLKVRGMRDSVISALSHIENLLKGDMKVGSVLLKVNKLVFSALIGKKGATLRKLEGDHNMRLDLLKTKGLVRIRCLPEYAADLKQMLVSFLDEVKTTVIVEYSEDLLNVSDEWLRAVENIFHVEISKTANKYDYESAERTDLSADKEKSETEKCLVIKGLIRLVDFAEDFVKSHIRNGEGLIRLPVTSLQFSYLKSLNSVISEISSTTTTNITFDQDGSVIVLTPSSNSPTVSVALTGASISSPGGILQCKQQLIQLLTKKFPLEFVVLNLSQECLHDLASKSCETLSESTGASISFDLPQKRVIICGTKESVKSVADLMMSKQQIWNVKHPTIPIEEFLLPAFVGKSGSAIVQLEKETQVKIFVNRPMKRLEVEGNDNLETVINAVKVINEKLVYLRTCHYEITMGGEQLGSFIGKEGCNIKKFRLETSANIDVDNKTGVVRVSGEPDKVQIARDKILQFVEEDERNNFSKEILVTPAAYPFVIGTKGASAKEIQNKSGARLELDRNKQVVVLRGSKENCEVAYRLVEELLEQNGLTIKVKEPEVKLVAPVAEEEPVVSKPKIVPGLITKNQPDIVMSKSALRRMKKKQEQNASTSPSNNSTSQVTSSSNNGNHVNAAPQSPPKPNQMNSVEREDVKSLTPSQSTASSPVVSAISTTVAPSLDHNGNIPQDFSDLNNRLSGFSGLSVRNFSDGLDNSLMPPPGLVPVAQKPVQFETFSMEDLLIPSFGNSSMLSSGYPIQSLLDLKQDSSHQEFNGNYFSAASVMTAPPGIALPTVAKSPLSSSSNFKSSVPESSAIDLPNSNSSNSSKYYKSKSGFSVRL